jgi:hypothetical protein
LRAVVRRDRAVLAIDLGEDKQVAAVVDHEGRVLARKTVRAKAYQLGELLAWAAGKAAAAGFAGLVVACEPTGHRWKAVMGLADAAGRARIGVELKLVKNHGQPRRALARSSIARCRDPASGPGRTRLMTT